MNRSELFHGPTSKNGFLSRIIGSAFLLLAITASVATAKDVSGYIDDVDVSGRLIIVDSPVHRHLSSGQKMVLEQERRLAQSLEVAIPPTPGRGFVWKSSTRGEWADAGLSWAWAPPNRSARARLSRLRAYARVRREPADLLTFTGTKSTFNAIGNAT